MRAITSQTIALSFDKQFAYSNPITIMNDEIKERNKTSIRNYLNNLRLKLWLEPYSNEDGSKKASAEVRFWLRDYFILYSRSSFHFLRHAFKFVIFKCFK